MGSSVVLNSLSTELCNTNPSSSFRNKPKFNLSSTNISLNQYRTDLDSHADTCTIGNNALITHVHEINGMPKRVKVHAYDPSLGCVQDINVVNAAVAYDCPHSGEVLILKINQAIHIPSMSNNLLCVMQLRLNDVNVFERPKFLTEIPNCTDHSIVVSSTEDINEKVVIPLALQGVTSFFYTRKPTLRELEVAEREGRVFDLTYDYPEWDPHVETYHDQEIIAQERLDSDERELSSLDTRTILEGVNEWGQHPQGSFSLNTLNTSLHLAATTVYYRNSQCSSILSEISPTLCEDSFLNLLTSNVIVAASSTKNSTESMAQSLVRNWGIGIEAAKRTVKSTTQRILRTVAHPSLSRRFRTNDRQLRYRRINSEMFTDTAKSAVTSKRGNKYMQFFSLPYGWVRTFPMPKKSCAHEALSVLFKRDGVPSTMVMDGSKEQTQGEFKRKCRESGCHIKQTEPHSPWSNSCEVAIKEVKLATGRDLRRSKCPKVLWDDCMERQAYIRSFTAHDIYNLKGESPETLVSGETPDISEFASFRWYEWIKYRDQHVAFPDDNFVLGRYLGPSFDIGPALTAKILLKNGEYIHRSTYRILTEDEILDPNEIKLREEFDNAIEAKLGEHAKPEELSEEGADTPHLPLYEDDSGGVHTPTPDRDDLRDDQYDQYLNSEVL